MQLFREMQLKRGSKFEGYWGRILQNRQEICEMQLFKKCNEWGAKLVAFCGPPPVQQGLYTAPVAADDACQSSFQVENIDLFSVQTNLSKVSSSITRALLDINSTESILITSCTNILGYTYCAKHPHQSRQEMKRRIILKHLKNLSRVRWSKYSENLNKTLFLNIF